jgi:hypothetical protein
MRIQEDGTAPPSFVATHLAALSAEGIPTQDDIDDIRGSAGTIYTGDIPLLYLRPTDRTC